MGICHDMSLNTVDSNIMELKVFAMTAERLWHEANGDGIGHTDGVKTSDPEAVMKFFRTELMPFLNAASKRLRDLSDIFREAVWACYDCNGEPEEEDGEEGAQ